MNKQAAWFSGWVVTKGSDTSGNWLHKGRRGKRGGSLPGGGHKTLGIASDAPQSDKKEAVQGRREERAKKPEPKGKVKAGDYVRSTVRGEFGGKVVGQEGDMLHVRNRGGDVFALHKDDAKKISHRDAVRFNLEAEKTHKPSPPPKKLPKEASFVAENTQQLNNEYMRKYDMLFTRGQLARESFTKGSQSKKQVERRLIAIDELTEALENEYSRLALEFQEAGV